MVFTARWFTLRAPVYPGKGMRACDAPASAGLGKCRVMAVP
jgi:hypothetical protein